MCLGVPAMIKDLLPGGMACAEVEGNLINISVRLTPDVKVGDYVLIHAGFALEVINQELAHETMEALAEVRRYAERR